MLLYKAIHTNHFKKKYYKVYLRKERENSIILHLKNLLMLFSEVIYFVNSFIYILTDCSLIRYEFVLGNILLHNVSDF